MNQIKTTITVDQMKQPNTWRLRINTSTYDESGRRIDRVQKYATVKGTRDQAEAERWKRLLNRGVEEASKPLTLISRDVTAEAAVSDMTVGEYADRWLERRLKQAHQGQTARSLKSMVRLYIKPAFGHLKLATLHKDQILEGFLPLVHGGMRGVGGTGRVSGGWDRSGLSGRKLAPRTIDHAMVKLLAIVTEAAEAGLCSLKACNFKEVKKALPRCTAHKNQVKAKALNDEQTDRLRDAVRSHWLGPVIRFALASGCRRGEICALVWKGVVFKASGVAEVSVYQSLADDSERTWLKAPKTDGSVRTIVIGREMTAELKGLKAEAEKVAKALRVDVETLPVFPNTRGNMLNPGELSDMVRHIMTQAGLVGFSLHSTRHTHASTLLRNGANIAAVSRRLGHSDPGFTLRVYSWAMPSEDAKLAELMEAALGGPVIAANEDEMEDEDELEAA